MKRSLAALGTVALAATTLATAPADAASTAIRVTSTSCGSITVTNPTTVRMVVSTDDGVDFDVAAHSSKTLSGFQAGDHYWAWGPYASEMGPGLGRVTVARCDRANLAPRVADGDVTGDGIADVVGVQAGTGALYSYRMTSAGLTDGTRRGTGWGSTTWLQQVTELTGAGNGNFIVAVHQDGSLWGYQRSGAGISASQELGHGFGGYTNFVVTQLNNNQFFGEHVLLASKGDVLYGWVLGPSLQPLGQLATGWSTTTKALSLRDFDGDNSDDLLTIRSDGTMWVYSFEQGEGYDSPLVAPRKVGSGWNAMQTVAAPGSFNGDRLTDLVARRSDGNLYRYTNTGGRWSAAVKVGQNWKGIRLLA